MRRLWAVFGTTSIFDRGLHLNTDGNPVQPAAAKATRADTKRPDVARVRPSFSV